MNSKTLAGNEYTKFRILIYYLSCALYNVLALFECLKFGGCKDSFIAFPLFGKGFVNGKTNHLWLSEYFDYAEEPILESTSTQPAKNIDIHTLLYTCNCNFQMEQEIISHLLFIVLNSLYLFVIKKPHSSIMLCGSEYAMRYMFATFLHGFWCCQKLLL